MRTEFAGLAVPIFASLFAWRLSGDWVVGVCVAGFVWCLSILISRNIEIVIKALLKTIYGRNK
jgi:hypothetical protein